MGEGLEGTLVIATKSTGAQKASEENLAVVAAARLPVYAVALTAADGGGNQELTKFGGSFVIPHSGNNR